MEILLGGITILSSPIRVAIVWLEAQQSNGDDRQQYQHGEAHDQRETLIRKTALMDCDCG